MKPKYKIIIGLVFIIIVFVIYKIDDRKFHQKIDALNDKYIDIKPETSFKDTVKSIYFPEKWRGAGNFQYVTMKDTSIRLHVDEFLTEGVEDLREILKPGAIIVKERNTDIVTVYKNSKTYYLKVFVD